jgi:hypothetical protein
MNIKSITLAVITLVLSTSANAVLVERLGGLAYYDTDADLTWLADANAAVGSVYDTYNPGSGEMNWADANAWAGSLIVVGVGGWRLPNVDVNGDDTVVNCYSDVAGCPDNEYGYMFWENGVSSASPNPFSNFQSSFYWSATEYAPDTNVVRLFRMLDGYQAITSKSLNNYAWAVQSGDVSAVPVPAAVWLFGSGLLGLIGFAKRK